MPGCSSRFTGSELGDELGMFGHLRDLLEMRAFETVEELAKPRFRQLIGDRLVALGNNVLSNHDVNPRSRVEQLVEARHDPRGRSEQVDLVLQRLRHLHLPEPVPEWLSDSSIGMVMEDDEVADALHFER